MITERKKNVLAYVRSNPGCSANDVRTGVKGSSDITQSAINSLVETGVLTEVRGPAGKRVLSVDDFDRKDAVVQRKEGLKRAKLVSDLKSLTEQLHDARERVSFVEAVRDNVRPPVVLPRERVSGIRELTGVALFSDWHVEENVDPESIGGLNEYTLDIADHRIEKLINSCCWTVEHHRSDGHLAIRDMVVWLGGDLMSGYIHEELEETNQLSPTETILWLQKRIRDAIYTILERLQLETLTVVCSYGNHGRTTKRTRIQSGYANSFEWLMYNILAEEFRHEPRVRFEITRSSHQYVEVYGKLLRFHHGDEVEYKGGVGGLSVPMLKSIMRWDIARRADVYNFGHFHQLTDLGRAVVNGSLIGFNPYAQKIQASPEPPQQAMYFMDSKRGKCMTTALWVN